MLEEVQRASLAPSLPPASTAAAAEAAAASAMAAASAAAAFRTLTRSINPFRADGAARVLRRRPRRGRCRCSCRTECMHLWPCRHSSAMRHARANRSWCVTHHAHLCDEGRVSILLHRGILRYGI
jgi:hypothetical protein